MSTEAAAKTVIPPLSVERQAIAQRLRAAGIGELITWDELEKLTGRPRDMVRGLTIGARRSIENEFKLHFRTILGSGVERIDFKDVVTDVLPGQRKRIGGAARRLVRITKNVVLDGLHQSERAMVLAHQTLGLLTEQACSNRTAKQMASDLDEEKKMSPMSPREAMARMLAR